MRVQKLFNREHNGKRYYKHQIVIPPKIIKKLGWKVGDDIKMTQDGDSLILEV